ncbi:MAG: sensor histidine kinase [Eubacteriales bacterium]|nr:sensor histidine kinase [Eubacteriales bacterium]
MNLKNYLKDKCLLLILHLVCMGVLAGFLRMTGYNSGNVILIVICWLMILCAWLTVTYLQRKKYFQEVEQILEQMDQRYLLGELLPDSFRLEDQLYRDMIRRSNKSVIERIHQIEDAQKDYKEYIESWVHEIKAPITSIGLLGENGRKQRNKADADALYRESFRILSLENQKIENYVDMALYYARSEEVYKDYLIRETDLQSVAYEVLEKNRLLLIQNKVKAEVDCKDMVYTDRKWIAFILNQMILNSVKYKNDSPEFHIYTERGEHGVILVLEDNGVGIRQEELSRIFEKGFTGSNGRNHERSTGMGLYLCRKLCEKLGIGIRAESEYGQGTKMMLEFPVSNYISRE